MKRRSRASAEQMVNLQAVMEIWNMKSKWKFLDSDSLKIIAAATMLIDHIGAALIEAMFLQGGALLPGYWYEIDMVLRSIGRTAFPIFAFLLAEGFFHTRSREKYFVRLALFALLSEIPFDLAFHGKLFYGNSQNVFWTLSLGFLVIWGMNAIDSRIRDGAGPGTLRGIAACLLQIPLVLAGCLAAGGLRTDYEMYGVLLIVLFYFGRYAGISTVLVCIGGYLLFLWEPQCIVGFLLILFYNGSRKKRRRGFQYFFYLFYPVHLLILGLLRVAFLEK